MVDLTDEERATREVLRAELDRLEAEYADANELPDDVDQRLDEIETALIAFEERPVIYDPADIARAARSSASTAKASSASTAATSTRKMSSLRSRPRPMDTILRPPNQPLPGDQSSRCTNGVSEPQGDADDADGLKPLSERLITELTAHRTVALRDALANDPSVAFTAVLHALCLDAFYRMLSGTCLEISTKSTGFNAQAPGLADSTSAKAIDARHQQWAKQLPQDDDDLWPAPVALDSDSQRCCSRTAPRSASMPRMSRGTATRNGLPMPTRLLAP